MGGRTMKGLAAAVFLLALSAGTVSAGGWATITADPTNGEPTEGEPTTIGFTVLQHGRTPAGWESPTLVATETATGEVIEAKATRQGPDGHFVATVTLPRAGSWSWHVKLRDLVVETAPRPLAVATVGGALPTMDATAILAAIEGSRANLRAELQAESSARIERLRVEVSSLSSQLAAARAAAHETAARLETLETAGGLTMALGAPIPAVLAVAALAGGIAGFGVARLGRPAASAPRTEEVARAGGLATH